MKRLKCPKCGQVNELYKWPVADWFDDGTESLFCPDCGHEVHERDLPNIEVR